MPSMKKKIVFMFSLALVVLIVFQSCSISTNKVHTDQLVTEAETTETENTNNTEAEDIEVTIMYAKTSLHIRNGAGTEFDVIGYLNLNDKIKVIGTCDNEWSRVEYRDKDAYVRSKYLSSEEIIGESFSSSMDTAIVAAEIASRSGMIGRLVIPSVGVNVALFNRYSQGTVDCKDSAGTYRYRGGQMVIADHKNQGFDAMKASIPNETIAYINDGRFIKSYICIDNNVGKNKNTGIPYDLLDCNGDSIYFQNENGICMYTCNDHWSNITYTYWILV